MNDDFKKDYQNNLNAIKMADGLKKLGTDRDFILIFENYYCKQRVLDLVKSLAVCDNKADVIYELETISGFMKFLEAVKENGAMAVANNEELLAIQEELNDE